MGKRAGCLFLVALAAQGAEPRTWSAWDAAHRFIWTYRQAGNAVVSEPGGTVGGITMQVGDRLVASTTTTGVPLRRSDASRITFLINDATAAGMTNADGQVIITAESDPIAALRAAAETWSGVTGSAVRFLPLETTASGADPNDRVNVMFFQDSPEIRKLVGSALAVTVKLFYADTGILIDTDIVFNPNVIIGGRHMPFSTTLAPDTIDLQSLATHELGHALGAGHTIVRAAAMYQSLLPQSNQESRLSPDDSAFVTFAYPEAGAELSTLTGRVAFEDGTPVRGAMVIAADPVSGAVVSTRSDLQDGTYSLPSGSYLLYAEPLDGPVTPASMELPATSVDTEFRTRLSGSPDIVVQPGSSPLKIERVGIGREGGSGDGCCISSGLSALPAGQTVDLLIYGRGVDAAVRVDFLGSGLTIRPDSLRIDEAAALDGIAPVRFTLEVAADASPIATLLLTKDGAVAAFTGGLAVRDSRPAGF